MNKEKKAKILNVNFDNTSEEEALTLVIDWLSGGTQKHITTPNPEMLLTAMKNPKFLDILNHSNLKIPDGIGILWAAKYLDITKNNKSSFIKVYKWLISLGAIPLYPKYIRQPLTARVTGSDFMLTICKHSKTNKNIKIFLLGAGEGVAEKVKDTLKDASIVATHAGTPDHKEDKTIQSKINQSGANLLFVAYRAPAQEIWITRNLKQLPSIKVAIGVGGAFDFIAGIKKRAPRWMQKTGLEWLYRLVQEPKRIRRIYNATVKFPITVLKENLKH